MKYANKKNRCKKCIYTMYIYSNICKNDKTGVSSYGDPMVRVLFESYLSLI